MADETTKSSFLYHQDKNRDGLIDVCEEVIDVEDALCPDLACSPNPNALVDDWKTKTIEEPFLNEKTCKYQVTVVTKFKTTIPPQMLDDPNLTDEKSDEAMETRFDFYVEDAIASLLNIYDKDDSEESVDAVKAVIEYTAYDLDPRPFSRLKLLYSVPYDDLQNLEDAEEESEDDEEEDEGTETIVTYDAFTLKGRLIRIRKGLNLYNRYLKMYRGLEGGNLFYDESNAVFPLEMYGDAGFFPTSLMGKTLTQLDKFLIQKGYNLPGVGGFGGAFNDRVVKMEFKFSKEFVLKRLKIWTEGCGEKPIMFNKKLKPLLAMSAWKDPTAMAYFARVEKMETDFTARTPKPWLEFIKEHTYPLVYDTTNSVYGDTDPANTAMSCISDALRNEAKELGQDILDDVFSIGDAIAYQFRDSLCRASLGEIITDDLQMNLIYDPNARSMKSLKTMATEQAFKQLQQEEAVFVNLCARILGQAAGYGNGLDILNVVWKEGFDKIKICGLFDLLIDAIGCLLSGLSLEEALGGMIKSALTAMGLENFGDLFVGLPPDKQAELDALVQKKLEEGDVFKEGSTNQQMSDTIAGKLEWEKPWETAAEEKTRKETRQEKREARKEERKNPTEMSAAEMQQSSQLARRTLVQQMDIGSEANQNALSSNVVMEAYIKALLEIYQDNLLELLDELNKFPGAPIVSSIIALLDCPRPPLFNPSVMDFIQDIELPWCRSIQDITFPRLNNPFGWIPQWTDIKAFIWLAIRTALQELILKIMMKLLVKICEIIGNALCSMLGAAGSAVAALAGGTQRTSFKDIIRESICGDDTPDEQIDNTIVDMFNSLGSGGAALADREQVLALSEDLASAVSRTEMMNAFLGDPSNEFLDIAKTIIDYEYPDMQSAFPNKESMGNFFQNAGNLMPASFKAQMQDMVNNPVGPLLPANPSLCATPQQLEDFHNLRCSLLAGRATAAQCEAMKPKMLDDLEDLADILQGGIPNYIANNMPPLVSDPGCDNGLLPFETDEQKATVSAALGGDLEQVKLAFSYDMLGNGPFRNQWGFINMILADTMGMPLTAHYRRVFNRRRWVDFYINDDQAQEDGSSEVAAINRQRGAFPTEVAGHLKGELEDLDTTFVSNNEVESDDYFYQSFEMLNIDRFGKNIDLLSLPDFGYNYTTTVEYESESVKMTRNARKKTPDVSLSYRDLAKGDTDQDFSFGFELDFFLSDLIEDSDGNAMNRSEIIEIDGEEIQTPSDNARVLLTTLYNAAANLDFSTIPFMTKAEKADFKRTAKEAGIIYDRKFEFLSVDNTLDGIDFDPYPDFLGTFDSQSTYMPQIVLLTEILNNNGASVSNGNVKTFHDEFMSTLFSTLASDIAANTGSFDYGAVFDNLTKEDTEYVTDDGEDYFDATNDDGDTLSNDDMILGVSRMQYEVDSGQRDDENRVFYLDPAQYGGNYMNPPIYIKPLKNEGWLGFVDVMFPELSPCKPQRTDLVDFEEIQSIIDDAYPTLPVDERLKSDPDCVVEVPYNRILERPSVAAIQGLITAAIRIFVSVHFIKGMATFTKFYPKFTEVFSSLFAQYIVEDMESQFKNTRKKLFQGPFKDSEFWYAFLEQSVQMYSRRVMDGNIMNPPENVLAAMLKINDLQDAYPYPYRSDLKEAKQLDEVSIFKTLKNYRSNMNLQAVQETEEAAKLVLKELVNEQLNYMGEKFIDNLEGVGMAPDVFDLDYYLFENLTQGSSLTLGQDIKEEVVALPTEGEELYTNGTEFTDADTGEMYTGYYHVYVDENGDTIYMAGEFHVDDDHASLRPVADQVVVPIGDVQDYGTGATASTEQPFLIEKYISIDGVKVAPDTALETIKSNDNNLLISEVYPGTLELVTDAGGKVVGLDGELGIRYGLEFSVVMDGTAYPVTTVEVDALDTSIGEIAPFVGDSKLLLCLINMLKQDDTYKLVGQYVFPLKKILALLAIYNAEGFLPSIGELTVEKGIAFGGDDAGDIDQKPGMMVTVDDGVATSEPAVEGWTNVEDRQSTFTPFVKTWDEWDQVLLRNSKRRIKKLFKVHYNSRDFEAGIEDDSDTPGKILLNGLREALKPPTGQHLLPRWQRRMLRDNPFNSKGELCEKED